MNSTMNTKLCIFGSLLAASMAWGGASQARATILYSNWYAADTVGKLLATRSGPDYYDPDNGQNLTYRATGNQVIMSGWTATKWMPVLSDFKCAYWSTETCEARLGFFANDGTVYGVGGPSTPNSVLWQSDWFPAYSTKVGTNIQLGTVITDVSDWPVGLTLSTNNFTWGLEFRGLTGENLAGVYLTTNSPSVGANFLPTTFWQQIGNSNWWARASNVDTNLNMSIAATFEGTEWVPEPSPVIYGAVLCGGIGLWIVRRRMQRPAAAK